MTFPDKSILSKRQTSRKEDIRGPFFRDQTAIIHCNSFRRLKFKTQAFFSPENDHVCTRIEHVLHVATIAATVCKGLSHAGMPLDDEIAYAAGLGHDLGHTPFGHSGERALSAQLKSLGREGFSHELQSLRVVDKLEQDGAGLNLTYGVRDAIVCHNGERYEQYISLDETLALPQTKLSPSRLPSSPEGIIVRFSDKIAYLGRDLEDSLRMRLITRDEIPQHIVSELGHSNGEIINALVIDLIQNSAKEGRIGFSDKYFALLKDLRDFNYAHIYDHPELKRYEKYCLRIVSELFTHFAELFDKYGFDTEAYAQLSLPCERTFGEYIAQLQGRYSLEHTDTVIVSSDFVSGMSDKYCANCYRQLVLPRPIEV